MIKNRHKRILDGCLPFPRGNETAKVKCLLLLLLLLLLLDMACRMSRDLLEIIDVYSESIGALSRMRKETPAPQGGEKIKKRERAAGSAESREMAEASRRRSKASCRPSESARYLPNGFTSWQTPCPCVPLCADRYVGTYLFLVKSLSSVLFNIFLSF